MRSKNARAQRGAVFLETLMALVPLWTLFLGISQLTLLKVGHVVVQHAANRAVRAAVVVLEDDAKHYDNAAPGDLTSGKPPSKKTVLSSMKEWDEAYAKVFQEDEPNGGARMSAIRKAAYHPLSILAPSPEHLFGTEPNLKSSIADSPYARLLLAGLTYNRSATAVTLHTPGSDFVLSHVEPQAQLEVRIAYLMPCTVPLVSALICLSAQDLLAARLGLDDASEKAEEASKLMQYAASPLSRDLNIAFGRRFTLISKRASLPNQGARYYPR